MAVTWPLSVDFQKTWNSQSFPHAFPYDILRQRVHAWEVIEWRRPLRPGMKLRVQGSIAAILPQRGGSLLVIRYDARDKEGNLVFSEYIGGFLRRVRCTDEGCGEENLPRTPERTEDAEPVWEKELQIDPMASYIYDGCTGMHFPIHTSASFARSVGLQGIILQGAATLSYALRELTNERGLAPDAYRTVSCRFTGMVVPGSSIAIRLLEEREEEGSRHIFFDVLNEQGKQAVSEGYLQIASS
jgi:acyl dehydratase